MKVAVFILAFFVVASGCSYSKRIAKVRKQFDDIGDAWSLEHPCPPGATKADTTYVTDSTDYYRLLEAYKNLSEGSDLQTEAQFKLESELYNKDERFRKIFDSLIKHPAVIYRDRRIVDSVVDTRALNAEKEANHTLQVQLAAKDGEILATHESHNKETRGLIIAIICLSVPILLFVGIKISSLFRLKV